MPDPVRGVEIFNTRLIRDLSAGGDQVTLPLHSSWESYMRNALGDSVRTFAVSLGRKPVLNGIWASCRLWKERFDVMVLANVANGLLPAVDILRRRGSVSRCVLIAHREPSARFLRAQKRLSTRVVSVNRIIADQFVEEGGYDLSDVYYGVTDADRFSPAERQAGERVKFCVVGQLDNAWKGADTAVAALRKLRDEGVENCELHLASFSKPEAWQEEGVVPYSWMPAEDIPAFLQNMDVMIVPSRDEQVMRETFSQVIVQGMLSGLPIIASDRPVLVEKLDAGGGSIFRSVEELAQQMKALALDAGLRKEQGSQGRKTALDRYVWDTRVFREKYLV